MLAGLRGTLLTPYFAERVLPEYLSTGTGGPAVGRAGPRLRRWYGRVKRLVGPATGLGALADLVAAPLAEELGYRVGPSRLAAGAGHLVIDLDPGDGVRLPLLVVPWGVSLDSTWTEAVRHGVAAGSDWVCCLNARQWRVVDARRPYARAWVEFDLEQVTADLDLTALFVTLCRAEAFARGRPEPGTAPRTTDTQPLFERLVAESARHAVGVCAGLRRGMLDALETLASAFAAAPGRPRRAPAGVRRPRAGADEATVALAFADALTVAYRILFLLFAESRGLVPVWHPVYRDSYTLGALVEATGGTTGPRGLWETLSAIARLAHDGCRAGDLAVNAFNGRLFSPAGAPLADSAVVSDADMARVLAALTSTPGRGRTGRQRISFRDLGVEELGAVYETVLDYEPRLDPPPAGPVARPTGIAAGSALVRLDASGRHRKGSGSFYTPRSITEFVVRATLHPLVEHATSDDILGLRVLDPAMGSGAFLVGACHYLAGALERALVTEGAVHPSEIGEPERASMRRTIAERCLFGVDLNPVAVQLARLSLWLATLAADRPLTFLDHHLAVGDSLVGATLDDLVRSIAPAAGRRRAFRHDLPLFAPVDAATDLGPAVGVRWHLTLSPADTLAAVRLKEGELAALGGPDGPLARWRAAADLWCAAWFWDKDPVPDHRILRDLTLAVLTRQSSLPEQARARWLARASNIARARRFFHWMLEFPEVFFDGAGRARPDAGFDAVIGNPPWDMVRADYGGVVDREATRHEARALTRFARGAGVYRHVVDGHVNRYQLFVERALMLVRRGGRFGMVVPSGLATDRGCRALRHALLERCATDAIVAFDNLEAIFPIHRSVRFLAITSSTDRGPASARCRFGVRDPTELDAMPDAIRSAPERCLPITLTPRILARLSRDDLDIPDLRDPADLALLERVTAAFPALGCEAGWNTTFHRELNATEDRRHFETAGPSSPDRLPVVEGKHLMPFGVDVAAATNIIRRSRAASLLDEASTFGCTRLAYRDVASATNRLTLIAAVLPAGVVTTHTVFCSRSALDAGDLWFLCGLLNSYVANYLVRLRVTTHIGTRIIEWLPAPRPPSGAAELAEVARLARRLSAAARASQRSGSADPHPVERHPAHARLQALVARLYECRADEMDRILATFPLVSEEVRRSVARQYGCLRR